jgi:hypothetical protein
METGAGSGISLEEVAICAGWTGSEGVDSTAPDCRGSPGGLIEVVIFNDPCIFLYSLVTTAKCGMAVRGALSENTK